MPRENVEVAVRMEDGDPVSDGDRSDQAVDELAHRPATAPASAVERGGVLEIRRCGRQREAPGKEPSELAEVEVVTSSGEDFHADGIADRELRADQTVDRVAGG